VPDQDFLFALDAPGEPPFDMLAELARSVLGHIGYPSPAIDAVNRELRAAVTARAATGHRRYEVRFIAQAGELQIVLAGVGGPDWCTRRPLPVS